MDDFAITSHFRYSEFVKSDHAELCNIDNNIQSPVLLLNVILVARALEVFRGYVGRPLVINSGYRCPQLNELVCGAENSWHLLGLAVDLKCSDSEHSYYAEFLETFDNSYPFLIKEEIHGSGYIHVAFDYGKLKQYFGDV